MMIIMHFESNFVSKIRKITRFHYYDLSCTDKLLKDQYFLFMYIDSCF